MSKKIRVGINGFGRIGRVLFRAGFEELDIVAVNSLDKVSGATHLLKYDSTHGKFKGEVTHNDKDFFVNGKQVKYVSHKNPAEIPWKELGVDVVLECTGALKNREDYQKHIQAGAKKVFISAPADGVDLTVVYGVNHEGYDASKHQFISNASCTTNCLAPLVKVLHENFKIENGTMTTIHSYTNDQRILDSTHKDLRRARTAGVSMIPTTTGAAKAVGLVLPELKGKIDGISIRVPTPNVSVVDFTFVSQNALSVEAINKAFKVASEKELKNILYCEEQELVSVDFNGNPHSSIIDMESTMVISPKMAKVLSWYDNETGFSYRMVDFVKYMAQKGL
ncbi:MAG: type I glyceraldehyde-3-phosphate dehydrogenase [Bdellovibrionaceae bacterium]|nr:type I glyceraldehyde-3-phosphate dehydrogenase [Pseudobdellovibrionaceae bacterium]NUM56990.1 type I glyceraldehyde-3-phosphate dehydrogenase [Pseudobdellovibrionaceae bacterium]